MMTSWAQCSTNHPCIRTLTLLGECVWDSGHLIWYQNHQGALCISPNLCFVCLIGHSSAPQSHSCHVENRKLRWLCYLCFQPDSMGQVNSSPLGSPTSHRGMHPSLLSPTSMGPSGSLHSPISTLSSPMNGLASPFSVISSPMGPHSMNSPGMGYGASISPQVRL